MHLARPPFIISMCALVAGCVAATPPLGSSAAPPCAASDADLPVVLARPGEESLSAREVPGVRADAASLTEQAGAEEAAFNRGYYEARELEEHRACGIVLQLGRPDLASRFMDLYEQRYLVRNRRMWERLRVQVLFSLGRVQEAEAGVKMWEGTVVAEEIQRQIEIEKKCRSRARRPAD